MPKPNEFLQSKDVLYPSDESLPQKRHAVVYFDFDENLIKTEDDEIILCVSKFLTFLGLPIKGDL